MSKSHRVLAPFLGFVLSLDRLPLQSLALRLSSELRSRHRLNHRRGKPLDQGKELDLLSASAQLNDPGLLGGLLGGEATLSTVISSSSGAGDAGTTTRLQLSCKPHLSNHADQKLHLRRSSTIQRL